MAIASSLVACGNTKDYLLETEYRSSQENGLILTILLETDKIYQETKKVAQNGKETQLQAYYTFDIAYIGGYIFRNRSSDYVVRIGTYGIKGQKHFVKIGEILYYA